MKHLCLLLLITADCAAQDGATDRGARLYRAQCAIPYCHGPDGTVGRAPRLAGHHFNVNQMFKIITWGIPGTGMPEFTTRLKSPEIADLVAYVMTLSGAPATPTTAPVLPPHPLTPEAKEGRALFFDAARIAPCGSCHELDGWGVPVGPDLAAHITDLRAIATTHVVTAHPTGGIAFPAVLVERTESRVRLYDLTGPLPVLRTFPTARIAIEPGTTWRHDQATSRYTTRDLEIIASYLRLRAATTSPPSQ
jgi:mono/diheme cytochrome c family protein